MDKDLQKTIKSGVGAFTLLMLILCVFVVLQIATNLDFVNQNDYNTITVEGDAEIFAAPDIATISFSVSAEDKELAAAQEKVDEVVSGAIEKIEALDVDKKDIKTTYYNSYPRYDYKRVCNQFGCEEGERELLGYEVSQSITVKVRDLDNVSGVLNEVGKLNVTNVSGPNFDIEDRDALVQDARQEAIKEAKEKAKVLAKDLGVRLGKIVSFYEGGYGAPMYARAEMDMAMEEGAMSSNSKAVTTIPEGENRIYSNISIVYKIK